MYGDDGQLERFEPSWVERLDLSTSEGDFDPATEYIGTYLKKAAAQGGGVYGNLQGVTRREVDDLDWGEPPFRIEKLKAAKKKKAAPDIPPPCDL